MTDNPYASPVATDSSFPEVSWVPRELQIATQGKRFLNLIIDNIIIQVLSTMAGFVIGILYAVIQIARTGAVAEDDGGQLQLVGFLVGLMVAVGYFVFTEALFQRTLAKFITGTMVVNADGGRPSFGQIVGRSFARLIPFEAFSFLGSRNPVGWHDSMSGTRVISTR